MDSFTDVTYEVENGLAWITINRPERYNSFRARTVDELVLNFKRAWASDEVGVIVLTGAGEKAFCTGGDQKQRMKTGDYGPSESGLFEVDSLHRVIRDVPKPVIAAVNGFAIGDGHVLHLLRDLTIATDTARIGQNGPRVGSFDAGFGTGLVARAIGEKRAREIWSLCRQYSAQQAVDWGLANTVVPAADLRAEVRSWADEILKLSPTALKVIKQSFNVDTEHFAGVGQMAYSSLKLFGETPEAREGSLPTRSAPRTSRPTAGTDVQLSAEQQGFVEEVRRFCDRECGTLAKRDAITGGGTLSNSRPLLAKLAEQGWLGVSLPEQHGGGGAGFLDECLFLEATSRGLAPVTGYSTGLTAAQTYLRWGSEEQQRTIVGNLVAGRLEAIALSEPGAGSDLGGVRLQARRDSGEYVLESQKTWISAAHVAEHLLVLAREDTSGTKHQGLTLLMVPTSSPRADGARHRDDGAAHRQRRLLHRRAGGPRRPSSASRAPAGRS